MHPTSHSPPDLATISEAAWTEALRREAIIRPLAEQSNCSKTQANFAAQALGLSVRRIYMLIGKYRHSGGLLTSLVLTQTDGGRGKIA